GHRFLRVLALGRVGEAVEAALLQVTEFVRRHPFALVVGEEDLAVGAAAPAEWVAEAEADFLRLLPGNQSKGTAGAGQVSVGVGGERVDEGPALITTEAVAVIVSV